MLALLTLSLSRLFGLSHKGLGPPLFFATGLNNCMPSHGYSQFLSILQRDFTVFCCDTASPLRTRDIDRISSAIDRPFLYVGHSSLVPSILSHESVCDAVLLDPASLPTHFDPSTRRFVPRAIDVEKPVMVINAEYTTNGAFPFIPVGFELKIPRGAAQTIVNVGHADILDDQYASACHLMGIRGHSPLKNARAKRNEYRLDVADRIRRFRAA